LLEDVFQRWRVRLKSSHEARDELNALLRDRETRSRIRRVDTGGEEISDTVTFLNAQFWQDHGALLSVVPDADGVGDHLGIDYTDYTEIYWDHYSPGWRWEFSVRRLDVERWEGLHPWLAAPPPRPSASHAPDQQQSRPTEAPPSTAAASAVNEVATQDVSREAQGVEPFNTGAGGRPTGIHVVLPEAERRLRNGEVEVVRGKQEEFADDLADWWEEERKKHTPHGPKITGKTIRNNADFRRLWRQALAAKSQNPPPENPETN
jgi:hypothetical protein